MIRRRIGGRWVYPYLFEFDPPLTNEHGDTIASFNIEPVYTHLQDPLRERHELLISFVDMHTSQPHPLHTPPVHPFVVAFAVSTLVSYLAFTLTGDVPLWFHLLYAVSVAAVAISYVRQLLVWRRRRRQQVIDGAGPDQEGPR